MIKYVKLIAAVLIASIPLQVLFPYILAFGTQDVLWGNYALVQLLFAGLGAFAYWGMSKY